MSSAPAPEHSDVLLSSLASPTKPNADLLKLSIDNHFLITSNYHYSELRESFGSFSGRYQALRSFFSTWLRVITTRSQN